MTAAVASLLAAATVAAIVAGIAGAPGPLARRVRPYVGAARSRLGLLPGSGRARWSARRPPSPRPADLGTRLEHAGLHRADAGRVRLRWVCSAVAWTVLGFLTGAALHLGPGMTAVLALAAAATGASRPAARLERAIESRRERMRAEAYTVDQILAVRIRSGSPVGVAIERVVRRGRGPVIDELEAAMRMHRTGLPLAEALRRVAERTPEPACARTYRALAAGTERGTELGGTLLALAEDVRDARREAVRRRAVRRRAAMLVPIVAVLAPVLLLFVAAPLPSIVFGTP